jgi:chemotaxis protein CheD
MYARNSINFGKEIRIIYPGEYYVSKSDEIIGTLLGSCVSICLHDPERELSGMNHFMLPGRISNADIFRDRSARYGITATYELLAKVEKDGSKKKNLIAKVFGGGHVMDVASHVKDTNTIPFNNIRLAKMLLELEDIPIVEMDVGGVYTRKLMMDVKTGKVYVKRTSRKEVFEEVMAREREYVKRSLVES